MHKNMYFFLTDCFLSDYINDAAIFSSIAVYKALYKSFGGFAADVVAAIDQVCPTLALVQHCLNPKTATRIFSDPLVIESSLG